MISPMPASLPHSRPPPVRYLCLAGGGRGMATSVNSVVPPWRFMPITRLPASWGEPKPSFPPGSHLIPPILKGLPGASPPPFLQCGNQSPREKSTRRFGEEGRRHKWAVGSVGEDLDLIPVQSSDWKEEVNSAREWEEGCAANHSAGGVGSQVDGFALQRGVADVGSFLSAAAPSSSSSSSSACLQNGEEKDVDDFDRLVDRAINATIVLAAGTFAITKLLTIDRDYWHGWTLYEILRYAPQHNWTAYEEALKMNPVLAKMMISGVVYSLGDWIAQCYEGKPLFEFNRTRMLRSGLVGFTLHGSLSHYYYQFCEALFPFQEWWVVPAKVAFDQTAWAALWNSIYYLALGFLRFESPSSIFGELQATFWPMLTAGWKLWPFAHLVTYGLIPVEQRLLWVDCVELVWVTILSTYSNEKSEARHAEAETGTCEGAVDRDDVADHL